MFVKHPLYPVLELLRWKLLSESQSRETECLQRGRESRLECWRTFTLGKWSGEKELKKREREKVGEEKEGSKTGVGGGRERERE